MKKAVFFSVVLFLFVAPALADPNVVIWVEQVGDTNEVTVNYDMNGVAGEIRAFGLDITVDSGAIVYDACEFEPNYWVYPGSIDINEEGGIDDVGSPIADGNEFPGTQPGLDSNGVTIEMGSLYVGANSPPSSGVLLSIFIDSANDCNVVPAGNAARTGSESPSPGIVFKNWWLWPHVYFRPFRFIAGPQGCACLGDVSSAVASGVPDGKITDDDIVYINSLLVNFGGRKRTIASSDSNFDLCADVSSAVASGVPDGKVTDDDIVYINSRLVNEGGRKRTITCP